MSIRWEADAHDRRVEAAQDTLQRCPPAGRRFSASGNKRRGCPALVAAASSALPVLVYPGLVLVPN